MYRNEPGSLDCASSVAPRKIMLGILTILVIFSVPLLAVPSTESTQLACSVNSVASASDLSNCSYVVIESFTVPDGGRYRHLESFPTLCCSLILQSCSDTVTMSVSVCQYLIVLLSPLPVQFADGAFVTMAGEVTFANTTCEFLLVLTAFRTVQRNMTYAASGPLILFGMLLIISPESGQ